MNKSFVSFFIFLLFILSLGVDALTVSSTSPSANALNVSQTPDISVVFSTPVDDSTLTDSTVRIQSSLNGSILGNSLTYENATNTLRLGLPRSLQVGETVTLTLTGQVKSAAGDDTFSGYCWQFFVGATSGHGNFERTDNLSLEQGEPDRIAAGDLDGDGDIDLAVARGGEILLNDGSSNFVRSSQRFESGHYLNLADIDNDGDLDTLTSADNQIRISKNSAGIFTLSSQINISNNPQDLGTGDFDNDGDIDLFVTRRESDTCLVFQNDGTGIFTQAATLQLDRWQAYCAVGDLDRDGDLDIVTVNGDYDGVMQILKNSGDGNFQITDQVTELNCYPQDVGLCDFDQDGDLDAYVTADYCSVNVQTLLNDGSGSFTKNSNIGSSSSPHPVICVDSDGDGDFDLVEAVGKLHKVVHHSNDGSAQFTSSSTRAVSSTPAGIANGDFDGDGDIDLAISSRGTRSVDVLLNSLNQLPTAGSNPTVSINKNKEYIFTSVDFDYSDSNGDQFSHLKITSSGTTSGTMYLDQDNDDTLDTNEAVQLNQEIGVEQINQGHLRFQPDPNVDSTPYATFTYQVKDGTAYSTDSATMQIIVNLISSTVPLANASNINPGSNISAVFTAEIDTQTINDENIRIEGSMSGRMGGNSLSYNSEAKTLTIDPGQSFMTGELISVTFTNRIAPVNTSLTWSGYMISFSVIATMGYANFEKTDNFSLEQDSPQDIAAGDLDGDNDIDIAIARGGEILINDGVGGFSRSSQSFSSGHHLSLSDIEGDGDLDIITSSDNAIHISKNTGSGSFSQSLQLNISGQPEAIGIGDFDNDGDNDLVVTQREASTCQFFSNDGQGSLTQATTVIVGGGQNHCVVGDWDSDGDLDVALSDGNWASRFYILMNDGSGAFAVTQKIGDGNGVGLGSYPQDIGAGDLDGDGDLDIYVSINYNRDDVAVLINDGHGIFAAVKGFGKDGAPHPIILADWDGDGDLDAVEARGAVHTITLHLNDGSADFTSLSPKPVSPTPSGLASGDWDGDGDLDLAIASRGSASVDILMNRPNRLPTIRDQPKVIINKVKEYTFSIVDFDYIDQDQDAFSHVKITSSGTTAGIIYVDLDDNDTYSTGEAVQLNQEIGVDQINHGHLRFKPDPNPGNIPHATFTYQVKDGTNYSLESATMQLMVDLIVETEPTTNALNINSNSAIVVEFNADITPTTLTHDNVKILGSMSGFLTDYSLFYISEAKTLTITPNSNFRFGELVTVTLTDGIKISTGEQYFSGYSWQFSIGPTQGHVNLKKGENISINGDSPEWIASGDLDLDGDLDVAIAKGGKILTNDGTGHFTVSNQTFSSGDRLELSDIDQDGDLDILTSSGNFINISTNQGNASFDTSFKLNISGEAEDIGIGDFDNDGDCDLLVTQRNRSSCLIYTNNGSGSLELAATLLIGSGQNHCVIGDWDNDGDLDAALSDGEWASHFYILINDGAANFAVTQKFGDGNGVGLGSYPQDLGAGDLDGDGDLDIYVPIWYNREDIAVLINNGSGTFSTVNGFGSGSNPHPAVLVDWDSDGDLDAVEGNSENQVVKIHFNNNAVFSGPITILTGSTPSGIATGDWDNDGDLDAIVANQNHSLDILANVPNQTPTVGISPSVMVSRLEEYVFSTGDFQYQDGDGDAFSYLKVNQPASDGILYLDSDQDDTYDEGELVSEDQIISTSQIVEEHLRFKPDSSVGGVPHATFSYQVSDGKDYSQPITQMPICTQPQTAEWSSLVAVHSHSMQVSSQYLQFGMASEATEGFDQEADFIAPPTSQSPVFLHSHLLMPAGSLVSQVSSDFRPPAQKVTYTFKVRADVDKFTLAWDPSKVPAHFNFLKLRQVSPMSALVYDMRTVAEATFEPISTTYYVFELTVGEAVTVDLKPGWNMISIPGIPVNPDPATLVTESSGLLLPLYRWNPKSFSYETVSEMKVGEGYWALSQNTEVESLEIPMIAASSFEQTLFEGWNMIGSVSSMVDFSAPSDDPDSSILQYSLFTWLPEGHSYQLSSEITSGTGYWVLSMNECQLLVTGGTPATAPTRLTKPPKIELPITVETSSAYQQLVVGTDPRAKTDLDFFDQLIPPTSPAETVVQPYLNRDGLDYKLQKDIQPETERLEWEVVLDHNLESVLTVDVSSVPDSYDLFILANKEQHNLREKSRIVLSADSVILRLELKRQIPAYTSLLQNYPNPFNPETWIPFDLAEDAEVKIDIYDGKGQLVRRLSVGYTSAGAYRDKDSAAYWDGRNANGEQIASGLYFYHLQAGDYSQTHKMVILK
ncbi:MAG: hypothetical protein CML07_01215 [Psychrobacter sp.]|nr:hypothetical protein [Psychrobacter sp.]